MFTLKFKKVFYFTYRRDACFDAHLFRRLFCLSHGMPCARSNEVTACICACKYHSYTLKEKQMESKRPQGKK